MSIADIPGLGAYLEEKRRNQQESMQNLQQGAAALGLLNALKQSQQQEQLGQALAASGGDLQQAMRAAIANGNLAGAARLAPLVAAQQKANAPRVMSPGSSLVGPDNKVLVTAPTAPPKPDPMPEIVKLQKYLGTLPPASPEAGPIRQRINLLSTRGVKDSTLPDQVKNAVATIQLKVLKGGQVLPQERAFLDEYSRTSPFIAAMRDALHPTGAAPNVAPPAAPAAAVPPPQGVARPTTQADFNALPSGALYVNPADGQTYRKK